VSTNRYVGVGGLVLVLMISALAAIYSKYHFTIDFYRDSEAGKSFGSM